jgi:hypothetical protein
MVLISCDTHDEADAIWRRLHLADEPALSAVQVWVAGSLTAQLRCGGDGLTVPHEAQQPRS